VGKPGVFFYEIGGQQMDLQEIYNQRQQHLNRFQDEVEYFKKNYLPKMLKKISKKLVKTDTVILYEHWSAWSIPRGVYYLFKFTSKERVKINTLNYQYLKTHLETIGLRVGREYIGEGHYTLVISFPADFNYKLNFIIDNS
jgi:hypothetical protein